jgi:hypothetical protein
MSAHLEKPLRVAACLLAFTLIRCQDLPYSESFVLEEVDGSGVHGRAILSYEGDEIWLEFEGRPVWYDSLVGHVHRGRCGNTGEIVVTLDSAMAHGVPTRRFSEGGYAIDVHEKAHPDGPPLACGNL